MKPYYERAGITVYHGDCRDVLPTLPKVDLVLTDPPYGIGYVPYHEGAQQFAPLAGDQFPFDPAHLLCINASEWIIWGGNNFANSLPKGGWLCWDKRVSEAADKMHGSPFELAWCSRTSLYKIFRIQHGGAINADGTGVRRKHPTQKPIGLMAGCIAIFPESFLVLDPYMGSGTTLVAAKNLRRQAIGIEIEERYCEIAAERLSQDLLDFGEAS